MSKKYIGSGKSTQYSKNIQVNLNQLFENIYSDTQNKNIAKIFGDLKKELQTIDLPYISKFKSKEKDQFVVKIAVGNKRETDKFGNDLNVELNEYVAKPKENNNIEEAEIIVDEMPF